jgi:hypothetical protein
MDNTLQNKLEAVKRPEYILKSDLLSYLTWGLFGILIADDTWKIIPLHVLALILATTCLTWQYLIIRWTIKNSMDEPIVYRRIDVSNYWRLFFITSFFGNVFAKLSAITYIIVALLYVPLFLLLLSCAIVDYVLDNEQRSGTVLGFAIFLWSLYTVIHQGGTLHYGVPLIGHYLESRQTYSTERYFEMYSLEKKVTETVLARVIVERPRGENPEHYIWFREIRLSEGGWLAVSQQEPLTSGGRITLQDVNDESWLVSVYISESFELGSD